MKAALAQAQALIEAGFAAQNAGDRDTARQAYAQALRLVPEHPTALQLLGLMARQQNDFEEALRLMKRSLAVHPRQPHVWNNLANTQEDLGDAQAALGSLDQALSLQPDYAEAHFNRARLLRAAGELETSQAAVQRAIHFSGQQTQACYWQLWAQIRDALQGPREALDVLMQGLEHVGAEAQLLHDAAVILQRLGRHVEALGRHEEALQRGLQAPDAHYNRGNTLQSLGQLERAEQAYLSTLAQDPWHELAHYDLARLRWRLARSDWADALAESSRAAQASGRLAQAARLKALQAHLLWRAEQIVAACEAYDLAWQWDPRPEYLDGVARCTVRKGEWDTGLKHHERAVGLAPGSAALLASYASSLMVAGRPQEALAPARTAVDATPLDQYAWALLSTLYRATHPERANALLAPELLRVVDLSAPPGFPSMAAFNAALAKELHRQHHDRQAPLDQTLRGGTQTLGNLFDLDLPLVSRLRALISQAIDEWLSTLEHDPGDPFRSRHTGRWKFTDSWSSRLQSQGQHTNHVHPHGWISAVYYVEVPAGCSDPVSRQGWLQFGEPDLAMAAAFPPLTAVQPQPGRLVLFPSYWWHGTVPFQSAEVRTTVAFDILPEISGKP